tara:strand:+ start:1132 stop:1518 length:387 start_codon:yes stop_codon:yes gene_type:complete
VDKEEQFAILWDTYNFITPRIHELEVKYEELLHTVKQYCMEESKGIPQTNGLELRIQVGEVIIDLETYYVKQISIVNEILEFQEQEKFTPTIEHEVDSSSLTELKDITMVLLESHRTSASEIIQILSA